MIRSTLIYSHLNPVARISKTPSTAMLLVACYPLMMTGCNERGVEEHRVQKGVESIPDATASTPSKQADPGSSDQSHAGHDHAEGAHWHAPDGWVFDPGPRPMRVATYMIPDEAGDIELAITRFPGRVGGELANINRWRGQMGLALVSDSELETVINRFEVDGGEGYETRIKSESGVMLASSIHQTDVDRTWFIRVTTTAESADRVQEAVFGFARTILNSPHGDG